MAGRAGSFGRRSAANARRARAHHASELSALYRRRSANSSRFFQLCASNLPTAVMPTWQEKRAVALQRLMDDPDLRDRPQLFNAAVATVNRMAEIEHAGVIDDSANEKAQAKAIKEASDKTENSYVIDH